MRIPAAYRAVPVLGLAAALLLAGCGGGGRGIREAWPDSFLWPLPPQYTEVSSGFGEARSGGGGGGRVHKGVDIRAPKGTKVRAVAAGRVIASRRDGDYGNVVIIAHAYGIETLYAHLDKRKAKPGKKVKRGEVIGIVGKTGNATGFHLHYELHRDGAAANPLQFPHRTR